MKLKKTLSLLLAVLFVFMSFSCSVFAKDSLPTSYSSVDKGYVTTVKNQGSSNNGWAFAVCSALETDAIIKGYETLETADFSEAYLVWSTFTASNSNEDINHLEKQTTDAMYTTENSFNNAVPSLVEGCGINYEKNYPYDYTKSTTNFDINTKNYYYNCGYTVNKAVYLPAETTIKEWISAHGAAASTVYLDTFTTSYLSHKGEVCNYNNEKFMDYGEVDIEYDKNYGGEPIITVLPTKNVNQSITIVGWDDNYPAKAFTNKNGTPERNGAWLCKNSYGSSWGNNGYFWLSYCDTSIRAYGYSIAKINYRNTYTYNGTGYNCKYTAKSVISEANVFNVDKNENISAISFYAMGDSSEEHQGFYLNNAYAEYSIVKLNSYHINFDPNNGTVVASGRTELTNEGYYKVDVNASVEAGNKYAVVVSIYADGQNISVPGEKKGENFIYTCAAGQSYINATGQWQDTTWTSNMSNLFINMYTGNVEDNPHINSQPSVDEPTEELNFFQKIGAGFKNFFNAIGNFFNRIFTFISNIF